MRNIAASTRSTATPFGCFLASSRPGQTTGRRCSLKRVISPSTPWARLSLRDWSKSPQAHQYPQDASCPLHTGERGGGRPRGKSRHGSSAMERRRFCARSSTRRKSGSSLPPSGTTRFWWNGSLRSGALIKSLQLTPWRSPYLLRSQGLHRTPEVPSLPASLTTSTFPRPRQVNSWRQRSRSAALRWKTGLGQTGGFGSSLPLTRPDRQRSYNESVTHWSSWLSSIWAPTMGRILPFELALPTRGGSAPAGMPRARASPPGACRVRPRRTRR